MKIPHSFFGFVLASSVLLAAPASAAEPALQIATFDVDATPPVGAMMAYDPVRRVDELTLRARGIVLLGAGKPIVLCAVDWLGIANEAHDAFCAALAEGAGTVPERVSVHTLHQHDAPFCDFTSERILQEFGVKGPTRYDGTFQREVIRRTAEAVRAALPKAQPVTHYGYGEAVVKEVASQRRIKGVAGLIRATRWSATTDPAVRAEPEGVIDPVVSLLSFWNGDTPIACLSFYACHPQSYYRTGIPSPDFPGIARFIRGQDVNAALHVHFDGAGGNVTAGKYNDGAQANRIILATRLAAGMREAYEKTTKKPISAAEIGWSSAPANLPPAPQLKEADLTAKLKAGTPEAQVLVAVEQLAWLREAKAGRQIEIACLRVGDSRVLLMPGELFVEYQLAAKRLRPDLHVMMAAYGDYGPVYIGTAAAYPEGGYETEARSSNVGPGVESVLMEAVRKLLEVR